MSNLENKANGFFKRIINSTTRLGTIGMLSALALLTGCSQIQYRAKVQTKPPAEIDIYMSGWSKSKWKSDGYSRFLEYKGKTSKEGHIYVESSSIWSSASSSCKIFLELNEEEIAYFLMNYKGDTRRLKDQQIKNLKLDSNRSKNCLEAKIIRDENGILYDLLFEIPKEALLHRNEPDKPTEQIPEVYKEPGKKYTEWGDEIKEEPKLVPEKGGAPDKPEVSAHIGRLSDKLKPVELCASIGLGSAYGGLDAIGASAGIQFNLGKTPALELFVSAGYLLLATDTWLKKYGAEAGGILHLKYFDDWSAYLKIFGGSQGKDVEWVSQTRVKEITVYGMGIFGGNRFVIENNFFISLDVGWIYLFNVEEWQRYTFGFDIGAGIKF